MRTNYVLIDYENVQPPALQLLDQEHFNVLVFVGATQNKVTYDLASTLQAMGDRARWIKISGNGSNALDFHIAFYIGQLAAAKPDAYFHIISSDTGFDPLIAHLKAQKIFACRSKSLTDIPALQASAAKDPSEQALLVIANLQQRGESLPRTLKTLTSTIHALFQKKLTDGQVADVLEELRTRGSVSVSGQKVAYTLPAKV